ncbi:hypothetical protein PTTG_03844 [Puccinia triticina 1-1 BBBD Race 1]|uniref:Uncharacterized protein n=1 Tax=Puccinia triticina (isolate 1-1 / race 1 (BBBD)) TaxID=630390 RepID=A0A180G1U5_PUCT1|nr:hypothetical protein PTTG_03844 [Puccinia triticina 1-1 BBBD Race 1]
MYKSLQHSPSTKGSIAPLPHARTPQRKPLLQCWYRKSSSISPHSLPPAVLHYHPTLSTSPFPALQTPPALPPSLENLQRLFSRTPRLASGVSLYPALPTQRHPLMTSASAAPVHLTLRRYQSTQVPRTRVGPRSAPASAR